MWGEGEGGDAAIRTPVRATARLNGVRLLVGYRYTGEYMWCVVWCARARVCVCVWRWRCVCGVAIYGRGDNENDHKGEVRKIVNCDNMMAPHHLYLSSYMQLNICICICICIYAYCLYICMYIYTCV